MAATTPAPAQKVDAHGAHDRVQMLSLKADGSPDQLNPEIIGDKEVAIEAAKVQFAQQAVSAVDQKLRGVTVDDDSEKDEEKLGKAHKAAEKSAEAAAERIVGSLYKD